MNLLKKFLAPGPDIQNLSPMEAAQRNDLTIVDVRQPEEWISELGHIEGATLFPLNAVMHQTPPGAVPDKPVLLVCRSGTRSMMAAQALSKQGFTSLYNLSGGMMAWNQAGLPVRTTVDEKVRRMA